MECLKLPLGCMQHGMNCTESTDLSSFPITTYYVYLCPTRFLEKRRKPGPFMKMIHAKSLMMKYFTSQKKKKKKKINPDFDCGVRNLWLFHFLLLTKISLSWFYGIWCTICIFNVIDKSTLIRFYVFCTTAKLSCESCSDYFCCFFLKNAYSVLNLKFMSFHI